MVCCSYLRTKIKLTKNKIWQDSIVDVEESSDFLVGDSWQRTQDKLPVLSVLSMVSSTVQQPVPDFASPAVQPLPALAALPKPAIPSVSAPSPQMLGISISHPSSEQPLETLLLIGAKIPPQINLSICKYIRSVQQDRNPAEYLSLVGAPPASNLFPRPKNRRRFCFFLWKSW